MRLRTIVALVVSAVVLSACTKSSTGTSGKRKLTFYEPDGVSLKPGETKPLELKIARSGFDEPVSVRFANLPSGVLPESNMFFGPGQTTVKVSMKAAPTAQAGKKQVHVSVDAPGGLTTTQDVEITVKEGK